MARTKEERKFIMKLRVEPETQDLLRTLAAGNKSMGKLLDDLAPALVAERAYIENGGGDRSPVTTVIRRAMLQRQLKEEE